MEDASQGLINISLAGPMRISDAAGNEVVNISPRSQQLIAILLRSGGMCRSRGALQTMLWDDSAADPAANLRQLLLQTRVRLKSLAHHLVSVTGKVQLKDCKDLTEIKLDPHAEFFEDSPFGTEEYEDWLRIERSRFYDLPMAVPALGNTPRRLPSVGLFNPEQPVIGSRAGVVTDWVSNLFRDVFTHSEFIEFYDCRTRSAPPCDLNVEISVTNIGGAFELSAAAVVRGRCHWSQSQLVPSGKALQAHRSVILEFAQNAVCATERCIATLNNYPSLSWETAPVYEVVSRLFSLSSETVQNGVTALNGLAENSQNGSVLAWQGFAKMVQNGERLVSDRGRVISEAESYIIKALEVAPTHPTVLAVAAHYFAYVARDYHRASELCAEALKFAPFSPFVRDICATLAIYTGDLKTAAIHADIACRLGKYGPMRHYLLATKVMLDTLSGHHENAIYSGTRLLQARPRFLPVMRFMSASLAITGKVEQAHNLVQELREYDQAFATDAMTDRAYAMPSLATRQHIFSALQQKGLQQ